MICAAMSLTLVRLLYDRSLVRQRRGLDHDGIPGAAVERLRLSRLHELVDDRLGLHEPEEQVLELLGPPVDGRHPLHPLGQHGIGDAGEEKRHDAVVLAPSTLLLHHAVDLGGAETLATGGGPVDVIQVLLGDAHQHEVSLERKQTEC